MKRRGDVYGWLRIEKSNGFDLIDVIPSNYSRLTMDNWFHGKRRNYFFFMLFFVSQSLSPFQIFASYPLILSSSSDLVCIFCSTWVLLILDSSFVLSDLLCLSVCLCFCLSVCLSVFLSVYLSVYLSVCLCVNLLVLHLLRISPSISLFLFPSPSLFLFPSPFHSHHLSPFLYFSLQICRHRKKERKTERKEARKMTNWEIKKLSVGTRTDGRTTIYYWKPKRTDGRASYFSLHISESAEYRS